jgi:hypothetical protein
MVFFDRLCCWLLLVIAVCVFLFLIILRRAVITGARQRLPRRRI